MVYHYHVISGRFYHKRAIDIMCPSESTAESVLATVKRNVGPLGDHSYADIVTCGLSGCTR